MHCLTSVYLLDMIPVKYLVMGAILMALGSLFIVPVLYSYNGKKGRKIAAMVAAVLLIAAFGVGVYYINTTMNFLDEITTMRRRKSAPISPRTKARIPDDKGTYLRNIAIVPNIKNDIVSINREVPLFFLISMFK